MATYRTRPCRPSVSSSDERLFNRQDAVPGPDCDFGIFPEARACRASSATCPAAASFTPGGSAGLEIVAPENRDQAIDFGGRVAPASTAEAEGDGTPSRSCAIGSCIFAGGSNGRERDNSVPGAWRNGSGGILPGHGRYRPVADVGSPASIRTHRESGNLTQSCKQGGRPFLQCRVRARAKMRYTPNSRPTRSGSVGRLRSAPEPICEPRLSPSPR